jgi:acetyltransferase-like isoleucine patch superfamily enzyme
MGLGLVAYDLTYFVIASALYGGAAWVAARAFAVGAQYLPWPFLLVGCGAVFLITLIAEVGALTLLVPKLKPGRSALMRGKNFYVWMVRSLLRRILFAPGLKWFLFTSNTLRFLTLRALGARVAFSANMSSDVDVLDPSLLVIGPRAVVGARSLLSGHYVEGGVLILGTVTIGEKAMVAADVTIGPGATIGDGATCQLRSAVGPNAVLGKGARLGGDSGLDVNVHVGANADIGVRCYLARGVKVPDNARIPALTHMTTPPREQKTEPLPAAEPPAP